MEESSRQYRQVRVWSRPIKIAFLINPNDTSDQQLNDIINSCLLIWAGRYSPIIPTDGKTIEKDWWNLLVYYDADIIYSVIPLEEDLQKEIHKTLLPAEFILPFRSKEDGYKTEQIRLNDIGALGIEDLIKFQWNNSGITGRQFFFIEDSYEESSKRNFIVRNFGSYIPQESILRAFQDVDKKEIKISEVTGLSEFLEQANGAGIYPVEACRLRLPSTGDSDATGGFHLVVGNSPLEVIYHWNRTLMSTYTPRFDSLWIDEEMSKDEEFLKQLGSWISCRYHDNHRDSYQSKVVSYSLEESRLGEIAEVLTKSFHPGRFQPLKLAPPEFPFFEFGPSRFSIKQHESVSLVPSEGQGNLTVREPFFLQTFTTMGAWMVDVEIINGLGSHGPAIIRFPRRPSVGHHLFHVPSLRKHHRRAYKRITAKGLPSYGFYRMESHIPIVVPDAYELYSQCFERQENYLPRQQEPYSTKLTPGGNSKTGKVLSGLLKLFGNLPFLEEIFKECYWREVIDELSGLSDAKNRSREDIIRTSIQELKERKQTFDFQDAEQVNQLISSIIHRLSKEEKSIDEKAEEKREFKKQQLIDKFNKMKKEVDGEYSYLKDHSFDRAFGQVLKSLVDRNILLVGTTIKCDHCGSKEWVSIKAFGTKVTCDSCSSGISQPHDPEGTEWSYRINDLIGRALRKEGIYPLVLSLLYLKNVASQNFEFLPPQDVLQYQEWKETKAHPQYKLITDLDIVAFLDGKFIIGEVKSDPRGFKQRDIDNIKTVALDIFPDEIMFTAEEGDSKAFPVEVESMFQLLRQELSEYKIAVSWHLLDWKNYRNYRHPWVIRARP